MSGADQVLPAISQTATRIMRGGRVVACPIDDTLLLVIGASGPVAGQLPAEVNDDPASETSASVTGWRLASPSSSATHGFAALLQTDDADRPLTTFRLGQEGSPKRYIFAPRALALREAATILAELAGGRLADVLDSLVDALMQLPTGRQRLAAILALIQARKSGDGFIEFAGETHEGAIFLRGWARAAEPGNARVIVSGESPVIADCGIATFSRQDIPPGSTGFIGLLATNGPLRARDVEGLVYRGRGGWRYTPVHEHRLVAGPTETPGHIRSVLLQTHSSPAVLLRLRSAANSFEGRETISALPVPVRLGVDNIFQANSGAFLISGWLLDPDGHVQSVRLRHGRTEVRLDDRWTRLERSDVTDAFTEEPLFKSMLDRDTHPHGFIVFASGLGSDGMAPLHLELTLKDSRRAFLPLTPARLPPRLAALRQIKSIDPENWGLTEIVDRQIVPFLSASEYPSPGVGATLDAGAFADASDPPIIVAVGQAEERGLAPFLGLLALDPETRRAPIALVLHSECFRRQAGRIRQLAQFYRLPLRLMSAETDDVHDLLEAGIRALASETVVLLAGSLLPRSSGWYGKLLAAYEEKGGVVSPTLAYEDHSVRWAGSWADPQSEYSLTGRYAGYPLSAVTGLKLTRIAAASFECCIMRREAFLLAGGFSGTYLGSRQKGQDLGLRLSRAGIESWWLPSVQMLGSDETSAPDGASAAPLIERIDERLFSARWAPQPESEGNRIVEACP
ncbi:hypothetical protein [Sinorhizobium arboris]|uniref:hypothetical protein n=1 Tax=Sinorhizobium arboris TaxID=76745 RepID=UPI0003FBC852|nr:hypothetical protein [Sinorhizobium arboris]